MNTSTENEKREGIPYQMLSDKIDKIDDKLSEKLTNLQVGVGRLEASMMPRHEIEEAIKTRVPLTSYISDKAALEMQLNELKAQPAANWVKVSIFASIGFGCLGTFLAFGSTIIGLVALIASHAIFH